MPVKDRIHFIVNPISGMGRQRFLEKYLEKELDTNTYDYIVSHTHGPVHATELAEQSIKDDCQYIVAVGGDGSINEVARAVTGTQTCLGIIPTGSGNGLAHHLNIPLNIINAIKVINRRKKMLIDTGVINDHIFTSIAGIGFDAKVAYRYQRSGKRGFFSYLSAVTKEYPKYKPEKYIIQADDGQELEKEALFISFANSDQFGYNASIAPNARIDDGLLDIIIVSKAPLIEIPILAHALYFKQIDKSKHVEMIKARRVSLIQKKKSYANIDGEAIKIRNNVSVEIRPKSLNILIP